MKQLLEIGDAPLSMAARFNAPAMLRRKSWRCSALDRRDSVCDFLVM
ncbi:hypothetical protein [Limnohabitans sp.]